MRAKLPRTTGTAELDKSGLTILSECWIACQAKRSAPSDSATRVAMMKPPAFSSGAYRWHTGCMDTSRAKIESEQSGGDFPQDRCQQEKISLKDSRRLAKPAHMARVLTSRPNLSAP
jgi:hypothetical protein